MKFTDCTPFTPVSQGPCVHCGKPAVMTVSKLTSPTTRTEPVHVCNGCFPKTLPALPPEPKLCTIIIGLPGSGKTTLAKQLAKQRGWRFTDEMAKREGKQQGRRVLTLLSKLNRGYPCITTSLDYIDPVYLDLLVHVIPVERDEIEFIYFANEPEACKANVRRRNLNRAYYTCDLIDRLAKTYEPPAGAIPVWKPTKP